jgi:hypothetical protein
VQKRACRPAGHGEHARLSGVAGGLLGGRDGVGRREEPPRYESGFRAHGSNQRFHRLLRHAVARAQTTAPSLAGVSPAARGFSPFKGGGASAARDAVAQIHGVVSSPHPLATPTAAPSTIRRSLAEKRLVCGGFLDQAASRRSVACEVAARNRRRREFMRHLPRRAGHPSSVSSRNRSSSPARARCARSLPHPLTAASVHKHQEY